MGSTLLGRNWEVQFMRIGDGSYTKDDCREFIDTVPYKSRVTDGTLDRA